MEPEETFYIGDLTIDFVIQNDDKYAVRVRNEDGLDRWIQYPERRYETISGAAYGVLRWLDNESTNSTSTIWGDGGKKIRL